MKRKPDIIHHPDARSLSLAILSFGLWAAPQFPSFAAENEWITRHSSTTNVLRAVTYGNGRLVVVGDGIILSSKDGVEWMPRTIDVELKDITYAQGKFVAVGCLIATPGDVRPIIWSSTNGVDWTEQWKISLNGTGLDDIAYGNGRFFVPIVDNSGNGTKLRLLSSADAQTWEFYEGVEAPLRAITFSDGMFLAGSRFYDAQSIYRSSDGLTWTQAPPTGSRALINSIAQAGGRFVAVGAHPVGIGALSTLAILWSTNRMDWVEVSPLPGGRFTGVGFVQDNFFATGHATHRFFGPVNPGWIYRSQDGINWTNMLTSDSALFGVGCFQGACFAVGSAGTILQFGKFSPAPKLNRPRILGHDPSKLLFSLEGDAGSEVIIQSSVDLSAWSDWLRVMNQTGTVEFEDRISTQPKFYRARLP